jgi:hypothetical protein
VAAVAAAVATNAASNKVARAVVEAVIPVVGTTEGPAPAVVAREPVAVAVANPDDRDGQARKLDR